MWLQFFSQNLHFAVSLFAALVCAAICWLYLDASMGRHTKKAFFRWAGFAALSLSFIAQATLIEQSVLGTSVLGNITEALIVALRLVGYGMVIAAEIMDPLQAVPKNTGLELAPKTPVTETQKSVVPPKSEAPSAPVAVSAATPAVSSVVGSAVASPVVAEQPLADTKPTVPSPLAINGTAVDPQSASADTPKQSQTSAFLPAVGLGAQWLLPVVGFAAAGLYWRRATTGLERHLKRLALGFGLLALADLIALASLLRGTENPQLYSLVAAFGWLWLVGQLVLLAGATIMGMWVWSYLTKRFFSQLFMVFMTITVIVFFVVTVAFTGLLLRSIRAESLKNLQTAGNVLNYALESKQAESMAGARQLAANSDVLKAVQAKDHAKLSMLVQDYLGDNKQSILIITNQSGQVITRGHDVEQWGDSLSGDLLVRRALLGDSRSSVMSYKSVGAPTIQVRSAATIRTADGTIAGSVMTGVDLGSAFVDSLKQTTGWQTSVYADNTLAATTVVDADGKTRSAGLTLHDAKVKDQVLKNGQAYSGTLRLQNREVLGAFLPLKDVDNATIGMLMISEPQSSLLRTAGRSIELTFLLTGLLILLSVVPIYWVTKMIEDQLD